VMAHFRFGPPRPAGKWIAAFTSIRFVDPDLVLPILDRRQALS